MAKNRVLSPCMLLLLCISLIADSYGTGFYDPDQSASAQAQVDAVVARPQDASTLFFNPAGIVRLSPWEATAGFHSPRPGFDYTGPTGQKGEAEHTFFVPHLYFSANPPESRFAAGLGVNSPFGLGTDWGDEGFARYTAPHTRLQLLMVNPNVAYSMTDNLSIAVGADFYTADATFDRYIPSRMLPGGGPPGMDLGASIKADGDAWGWNAAFLYDISDRVALGASYRSKTDLGFSGSLQTYPPSPLSASCCFDLHLPSMLKAGIGFKPTNRLSFELDVDWLEWSRFEDLTVSFSPPVMPPEVSRRDWHDVFFYSIVAQYSLNSGWKLRAGYTYAESPIPDHTYEPGIPANDLHVVSFGVGKSWGKLTLDLACTVGFSEKQTVNTDVGEPFFSVDGDYDSLITVIGAGVSYSF